MSSEENPDEVIEVRPNEEFSISLDSNPTTGYVWEAEIDSQSLQFSGKEFELTSERIGAGGTEKFTFVGLKRGESRIVMIYRRPWEPQPVERRSFLVAVR